MVQTGSGGGGATVEIVHESLIATWPMLRRWLDETQEDSLFLEQLRQAARQWQANKRDGGLLWGGDMVDELARFQRRYRGQMPDVYGRADSGLITLAERLSRQETGELHPADHVGRGQHRRQLLMMRGECVLELDRALDLGASTDGNGFSHRLHRK